MFEIRPPLLSIAPCILILFNDVNVKWWIAIFIELFEITANGVLHARANTIAQYLAEYIQLVWVIG